MVEGRMKRHLPISIKDKKSIAFAVGLLVTVIVSSPFMLTGLVSAQSAQSWLHVDGKYVKDSQGNIIILHGVNFVGYELTQYLDDGWSKHTEQDYQKIASLGFNVVRLPISWQHIEPTEGNYDVSYFTNYIDRDIQWAAKYGIYVIISFHQWYWSPYFTSVQAYPYGFPSWLFSIGYSNTPQGESQSITDFWVGKAPNGVNASSSNPSMQDRMINAWKYVASRYKDNPTVVAYDLFNEPPSGTLSIGNAATALYGFIPRLISGVSLVDSNHIFIYEPITGRWDYSPTLLNTPNTIFSAHLYPSYNDATTGGFSGDKTVLENQISSYLNLPQPSPSANWNLPILIGEFGPSTNPFYSNNAAWVSGMADVFNEHSFLWTYFCYGLNSGNKFSLINPDRTEVTAYAKSVDKPYPVVSSVAPAGFSSDEVGSQFNVSFFGSGSLQTQIYLPIRYYPNGFSAVSSSASWSQVWDSQTRTLTVNAALQSSGITITISTGSSYPSSTPSSTSSTQPTTSVPSSPSSSPTTRPIPSVTAQPTSFSSSSPSPSAGHPGVRSEIIIALAVVAIIVIIVVVFFAIRNRRKTI